jgi:DNA-binding LacI/PurR family transcriptional regulator
MAAFPYLKILGELASEILVGDHANGSKLPSERATAELCGVTPVAAGKVLAEHVLEQGHTQIGVATRAPDKGIDNQPQSIHRVLASEDRSMALFAGNYFLATEIHRIALSLGLSVPNDLAIVTCDSVGDGRLGGLVPATTILQPLRRMGCDAASFLLNHLCGKPVVSSRKLYPVTFVPGASTIRRPS